MHAIYDTIGINYAQLRQPDPRIASAILGALGGARTVLNVGAGAGSYEPVERHVTALEPSMEMIRQRTLPAAAVVQGIAEELPFADRSFDASMAVLTVHHWNNQERGLRELRRVTRGPIVILTYDPEFRGFWLADYLPELVALDELQMPRLGVFARSLGRVEVSTLDIPHDCSDGFLCAYWRRPAAYLDARVRSAISSFWKIGDVSKPLAALESDLASGAWLRRNPGLATRDACDCGYRLVVAS